MSKKLITTSILFLLVGTLALAGCGSATNELQLGMEADGSQVELDPGQVLVVSLASNPTTGYGWHVYEIDESILKPVGEVEYAADSGEEQTVGSGGTETLRFEAVDSGTTVLTLTYDRIWESVPPATTFTLTVVVP